MASREAEGPATGHGAAAGDRPADAAFDTARAGLRATGASVEIRDLVDLLSRHGAEEGRVLAEYERLAEEAEDRAVRYLVRLILDDERRHHALLAEMATGMAWETAEVPGVPSTPPLPLHLDEELLDVSRRLLRIEEADRHELRALRKRLRTYADTTLWGLLVDLMLLDTEKHATVLRFLERHAAAT